MAHHRDRIMETVLKKNLTWSPSVSLIGMRQTGKSTLIKMFSESYLTFDDDSLPARFSREGDAILNQGPFPLGLDEVQKYPPVLIR